MHLTANQVSISLTNSARSIPQQDWDRLFGANCLDSRDYHIALEDAKMPEFELGYLTISHNNSLKAVFPFFIMDFSFTTIIQGKLQKIIFALQKRFKNFLKIKLLFIGFPTTEELCIGIDKTEDHNMLSELALDKFMQFIKEKKINNLLYYNVTASQSGLAALLDKKGFVRMENFPNARLKIRSDSLEGFIQGLSKNMRKSLKKKLRLSREAGDLKIEVAEDINEACSDIYRLYMNNFNNSNVRLETLTPEFFKNICRNMPGKAKIILTRNNTKLVAFNLCILNDDTFIDKVIGFDDEASRRFNLYYTTFCYNLEWCIKNGYRNYQLGIIDYHPKIRLGAELIPLYIYFKSTKPLMNFLAKKLARFIEPKNFDPALKLLARKSTQNKAGIVASESRGAV